MIILIIILIITNTVAFIFIYDLYKKIDNDFSKVWQIFDVHTAHIKSIFDTLGRKKP